MLSVVIASAIGAVLRYLLENFNRPSFPFFTLLANVAGSFLAGFAIASDSTASSTLIAFAGTFTTFSGLIAGTQTLTVKSRLSAFIYGHGSIALSLVAAWIGLSIG